MDNHKSIDWQLSLKYANNKPEVAEELLTLYVKDLPQTQATISKAYQTNNYELLNDEIHRLHGASCYCGVPNVKSLTNELEQKLRKLSVSAEKMEMAEELTEPLLATSFTAVANKNFQQGPQKINAEKDIGFLVTALNKELSNVLALYKAGNYHCQQEQA